MPSKYRKFYLHYTVFFPQTKAIATWKKEHVHHFWTSIISISLIADFGWNFIHLSPVCLLESWLEAGCQELLQHNSALEELAVLDSVTLS